MAGPWEKFAAPQQGAGKPWERFAAQAPETAPQPRESASRTAFDQGMQGMTFGFADEGSDALGALIAGGLSPDLTVGEAYKQARELTKERQARQFEQRPGLSIAANIAGGLLTGGAGASTKAGATIGNSLRTGNLAARMVKGAATGAASGGLYGAGTGEDGNRAASARQGALYGGVFGAALPALGAAGSKLNTKTNIPSRAEVKAASQAKYAEAERLGGKFKPEATDHLIDEALKEIPSSQFVKDVIGDDDVSKFVKNLAQHRGRQMSLADFEGFDKTLGKLAQRYLVSAPDMSHSFKNLQGTLREIAENPQFADGPVEGLKAFREGTRLWSISKKMSEVQKIVDEAQSFDVPATAIKTGFRRIMRNPKLFNGYSAAEKQAIKKAAETGRIEDISKTFGSKLFAMGAGLVGGPKGAALGLAANAAGRGGAEALKTADAAKVTRLLGERSGMATTTKRLQLTPAMMKKIAAMPPKAARALLDQMNAQP